MKYGPLVFLAAFFALSLSWFGFVLKPQVELGRMAQVTNSVSSQLYPLARPGQAHQGAEVYRANGCFYCHSQQVGQSGTVCNVTLTDAGTNLAATGEALVQLNPALARTNWKEFLSSLPKVIVQNGRRLEADAAMKALKSAGAKVELNITPVGPDLARGWGRRRTVAQDYVYDWPVMLGSQRVGPDLANVSLRLPDANWHLRHLYAPSAEVKGSTMPAYRFLFVERKLKPGQKPSPDAIPLTASGAFFDVSKDTGPVDRELVPTAAVRELVAYLLSLQSDAPLYEAPFSAPAAAAAK
ncbi:MAG TPA: cbb3-type cytochrome c oxidase subunit II [Verrucomicrobiae bacterium]